MEKINNIVENLSNGIYWVLIGIIVALIIATAVLFLYAFFVKKKNEHKHATVVRNAFATWMTGGLLSLIAIVFFASGQSGISLTFIELYFVIFFFSSLITAFKMFGAKKKNSNSNAILKFVDLGLPSGKLWAAINAPGFYTFDKAVDTFGDKLPQKMTGKNFLNIVPASGKKKKASFLPAPTATPSSFPPPVIMAASA